MAAADNMTAPRLPDWERRLGEYIAAHSADRFEWGKTDCALFSWAAVEAITGEHPAPYFLGTYGSRGEATKVLRTLGKGTLLRTMDSLFERRPVGMARRGDLVMAEGAIGVCMGAFGMFLTEDDGLARLPRAAFTHAWTV